MSRRRKRAVGHDGRWYAAFSACCLIMLIAAGTAITASNAVPSTKVEDDNRAVSVDDKKPAECAAITVTNLLTGSGNINGTNASELILGSSNADTIKGGGGDDCIVGGGGADDINGQGGTDVCIGGVAADKLACETAIQ